MKMSVNTPGFHATFIIGLVRPSALRMPSSSKGSSVLGYWYLQTVQTRECFSNGRAGRGLGTGRDKCTPGVPSWIGSEAPLSGKLCQVFPEIEGEARLFQINSPEPHHSP